MTQCARATVGDQAVFRQVCARPTITGNFVTTALLPIDI